MSENKIPTATTSLAAYEARLKYESNCSTNDAFEDGFAQGAHWMGQRIDRAVEEAVRKEREEVLDIVKSNKKHFMDEYKASMADGEENDSATDMILACDMILNDIKKQG